MLKHYIAAMLAGAVMLALAGYAQAQGGVRVDAARAAAIHECSVLAQRYPETTFSSTEFELYRACMARHGQVE
jgi:hypothetical protein